jgi:hypothetical protein
MARLQIPRHRADKAPEFCPYTDGAWKLDDIAKEIADLSNDEKKDHAFFRYHLGQTRFDLDAKDDQGRAASDYLCQDAKPEIWKLRRLKMEEWYTIVRLMSPGNSHAAALRACRYGVVGHENYSGPALEGLARDGRLSDADMEILFELDPGEIVEDGIVRVCGVPMSIGGIESLPVRIGEAVIAASSPPTTAEKKAFAS